MKVPIAKNCFSLLILASMTVFDRHIEAREIPKRCAAGEYLYIDNGTGREACVQCGQGFYMDKSKHRNTNCYKCDKPLISRGKEVIKCNSTTNTREVCAANHFRKTRGDSFKCVLCLECDVTVSPCTEERDAVCVNHEVLNAYYNQRKESESKGVLTTSEETMLSVLKYSNSQNPLVFKHSTPNYVSSSSGGIDNDKDTDFIHDTSKVISCVLALVVLIVILVTALCCYLRKVRQKHDSNAALQDEHAMRPFIEDLHSTPTVDSMHTRAISPGILTKRRNSFYY